MIPKIRTWPGSVYTIYCKYMALPVAKEEDEEKKREKKKCERRITGRWRTRRTSIDRRRSNVKEINDKNHRNVNCINPFSRARETRRFVRHLRGCLFPCRVEHHEKGNSWNGSSRGERFRSFSIFRTFDPVMKQQDENQIKRGGRREGSCEFTKPISSIRETMRRNARARASKSSKKSFSQSLSYSNSSHIGPSSLPHEASIGRKKKNKKKKDRKTIKKEKRKERNHTQRKFRGGAIRSTG